VLEVLRRPALVRLFPSLPGQEPATIIALLQSSESVEPALTPSVCRDPHDDTFLAASYAAGADFLTSEDRDLLDLKTYEGVTIVDAVAFIAVLEQDDGSR
jgi:putative PIN family toxin of toxin-antitoxin system